MYQKYSALIFDMDGTMVDSGQLHEKAWTATLNKFALPIDRKLMRSLTGVPTKETLEVVLKNFNLVSPVSLTEMVIYKEQFVHDHMDSFVKPTNLLKVASEYKHSHPLAIGTGAQTSEALRILGICGLLELFPIVVGADQVTRPKPAPDTFLRCSELLKINPKDCVVFEDSPLGLQAAEAAGMAGVDVLSTHQIMNEYFL